MNKINYEFIGKTLIATVNDCKYDLVLDYIKDAKKSNQNYMIISGEGKIKEIRYINNSSNHFNFIYEDELLIKDKYKVKFTCKDGDTFNEEKVKKMAVKKLIMLINEEKRKTILNKYQSQNDFLIEEDDRLGRVEMKCIDLNNELIDLMNN